MEDSRLEAGCPHPAKFMKCRVGARGLQKLGTPIEPPARRSGILPLEWPGHMSANEVTLTPMMAQYRRIKSELPKDALLLFRLGDFYEMFFEDAQAGAQLLNVALTQRNGVPMCGIPYHAANAYIGRMLRAGSKVAV